MFLVVYYMKMTREQFYSRMQFTFTAVIFTTDNVR